MQTVRAGTLAPAAAAEQLVVAGAVVQFLFPSGDLVGALVGELICALVGAPVGALGSVLVGALAVNGHVTIAPIYFQ